MDASKVRDELMRDLFEAAELCGRMRALVAMVPKTTEGMRLRTRLAGAASDLENARARIEDALDAGEAC